MLSLSCLFSVLALTILGAPAQAQSNGTEVPFALQSPGQFVQCKNTTIVWQGGKPPYKVALTPVCGAGKNASEETHAVLSPGSTSIELPIRFAKNTPLTISITDSTNMQATAPQTIVTSGDADDSCTTQTTCTDAAQAPNVPVAVADSTDQPTSTASSFATDRLITVDPSATSPQTQSMTDAYSSGSTMVIVYSYVSQTPTPSATAESSTQAQLNGAISTSKCPAFAVVGSMMFIGATLAFGL